MKDVGISRKNKILEAKGYFTYRTLGITCYKKSGKYLSGIFLS